MLPKPLKKYVRKIAYPTKINNKTASNRCENMAFSEFNFLDYNNRNEINIFNR